MTYNFDFRCSQHVVPSLGHSNSNLATWWIWSYFHKNGPPMFTRPLTPNLGREISQNSPPKKTPVSMDFLDFWRFLLGTNVVSANVGQWHRWWGGGHPKYPGPIIPCMVYIYMPYIWFIHIYVWFSWLGKWRPPVPVLMDDIFTNGVKSNLRVQDLRRIETYPPPSLNSPPGTHPIKKQHGVSLRLGVQYKL